MSEEILYIDDGELVYYINENEFITCDEIPYPMLEGIKHLQQKVEQLEKENDKLQNYVDFYKDLTKQQIKKYNQLENIRKEVEYCLETRKYYANDSVCVDDIEYILNKGSENNELD